MKAESKTDGNGSGKTIRSIADSFEKNEKMKELHDRVTQDLVKTVSKWICNVIIYCPGISAVLMYLNGDPRYINPMFASLSGLCASLFLEPKLQATVSLLFLSVAIFSSALAQGCTASLVPVGWCFIPCAFGFLYQSPRAVILPTFGVVVAFLLLFAIELSGSCPSEPLSGEAFEIVAERLIPMLFSLFGNGSLLLVMVLQSEKTLLLHANAATSAAKLADIRKDVLHRVTHELRTPLNGLMGSVELLTASKTLSEDDLENARTAMSCLEHILQVCDNVLLAAKLDQTKTKDRVKKENPFRLTSCVDHVTDMFTAVAGAKGIKLMVDFVESTTAMVLGMELELRQVLLNLVGNAVKFTETGSITIRVREETSSSPDLVCCTFEVEDTGIGVDQENAHMLFEAFHQGEEGSAVSRRHKGTGLGLAICREMVEEMGGTVAVDSERGRGSRFYFTLELKREPSTSTSDLGSHLNTPCQILVVDAEKESSSSCLSVVKSVAPSAETNIISSPSELPNFIANEKEAVAPTDTKPRRIAFIGFSPMDMESLSATLSTMREAGWVVFAYCDYDDFDILTNSTIEDAYAVFRRPFPLIRMGDILRGALLGAPSPRRRKSTPEEAPENVQLLPRNNGLAEERTENETMTTTSDQENSESKPKAGSACQKVVVVDDTEVNVRLLNKMLSRLEPSMPIVSYFCGQSAVDLVAASNRDDVLLILMDWHMPEVCGLTATDSIRRVTRERGGPTVYICMVTADCSGLCDEMESRGIGYGASALNGEIVPNETIIEADVPEIEDEIDADTRRDGKKPGVLSTGVDLIFEKPVTLKSVKAVLTWFQAQVNSEGSIR